MGSCVYYNMPEPRLCAWVTEGAKGIGQIPDEACRGCIHCKYTKDHLKLTDEKVEVLWIILNMIPLNLTGFDVCIMEPFWFWPVGTSLNEIWVWLGENHSKGTYYLTKFLRGGIKNE